MAKVTTTTMILGGHRFTLEIANTPAKRERGLMHRKQLGPNQGMWFPFSPAQPVTFWMKHCRMPLDLLFIEHSRIIGIVHAAQPCSPGTQQEACPLYPSPGPVSGVIELSGGTAKRLGLKTGDRL
jgi:uncharacterized protein